MKFTVLTSLLIGSAMASVTPYPLPINKNAAPKPYLLNQPVSQIQCIQRQIDTGEHKFDENNKIIYADFPACIETGQPLSLNFGQDAKFNCSITLTDEIYHLFQLYIHEDSPFSCRLTNLASGGGYIPLTINIRGDLESSHLDIDNKLNVVAVYDSKKGKINSINAFSSGSESTKFIIGDQLPLEINNIWFESNSENGFYRINTRNTSWTEIFGIAFISVSISSVIITWLLYGYINKKALKIQSTRGEFGIDKTD